MTTDHEDPRQAEGGVITPAMADAVSAADSRLAYQSSFDALPVGEVKQGDIAFTISEGKGEKSIRAAIGTQNAEGQGQAFINVSSEGDVWFSDGQGNSGHFVVQRFFDSGNGLLIENNKQFLQMQDMMSRAAQGDPAAMQQVRQAITDYTHGKFPEGAEGVSQDVYKYDDIRNDKGQVEGQVSIDVHASDIWKNGKGWVDGRQMQIGVGTNRGYTSLSWDENGRINFNSPDLPDGIKYAQEFEVDYSLVRPGDDKSKQVTAMLTEAYKQSIADGLKPEDRQYLEQLQAKVIEDIKKDIKEGHGITDADIADIGSLPKPQAQISPLPSPAPDGRGK